MSVQTSRPARAEFQEASVRLSGVTPKETRVIVALLFLFMVINFADKAVIGIAAVPMMQELRLSPSQFGLIGSSFFLLFSVSAIVTGFVVNRVQTAGHCWSWASCGH
jgi:MFS transporter, ACS family, D-galactonate transporter